MQKNIPVPTNLSTVDPEEKKTPTKIERIPSENDYLIKNDQADLLSDAEEEELAMSGGL